MTVGVIQTKHIKEIADFLVHSGYNSNHLYHGSVLYQNAVNIIQNAIDNTALTYDIEELIIGIQKFMQYVEVFAYNNVFEKDLLFSLAIIDNEILNLKYKHPRIGFAMESLNQYVNNIFKKELEYIAKNKEDIATSMEGITDV